MSLGRTELEEAVRDCLSGAVDELADGPDPFPAIQRRRRARRVRRAVVAAAAALALLGGVAGWVALDDRRPGAETLSPADVPPPPPPPPPTGQQAISFHGLQIFVPSGWPLNATDCGTATQNTVVLPGGATPTCSAPRVPGLTVVEFWLAQGPGGLESGGQQYGALATEPTTVDGTPAWRGKGSLFEGVPPVDVLMVPEVGVVITVESPDASGAALLSTVHRTPVDALGCVDHLDSLAARASERKGADQQLLPAGADRVVVCRYADSWLMRSATLSTAAQQKLETALASTPKEPQTDATRDCAEQAHRGILFTASYPEGPAVQLLAHLSGCTWSVTNAAITTGISLSLIDVLTNAVDSDGAGDYTRLP